MIAKFITTQYVRDNSTIDANVDSNLIERVIRNAQELDIRKALGDNLYISLQNYVYELKINNVAIPADYANLLYNYIQPAHVEWVMWRIAPKINYRFTNNGLLKTSTDNSEPVDLDEMKYLRQDDRYTAEEYTENIVRFLKDNQALFVELTQQYDTNALQPAYTVYFSGMYIPDGRPWASIPNNERDDYHYRS